ncbi:hypothetical protein BJY52DRAFT_1226695 [Lactarius psammicola]|nr:hypothetical protein BJY52DRAFT_1226695 [Lactarius psammicola]
MLDIVGIGIIQRLAQTFGRDQPLWPNRRSPTANLCGALRTALCCPNVRSALLGTSQRESCRRSQGDSNASPEGGAAALEKVCAALEEPYAIVLVSVDADVRVVGGGVEDARETVQQAEASVPL